MKDDANESWMQDVALNVDVFRHEYCGYWMRGMVHDSELGWLAADIVEQDVLDANASLEMVEAAWRAGAPLPANWYRLDRAFAEKALAEGQKKYGEDFAEDYDGASADIAVQRALLGDVLYG